MTLLYRPSMRNQRRINRGLQLLMLAIVTYGVVAAQPKAIVNGGTGFLVTLLPAIFERNYDIPLDPWLGLWVTTAVFLHTLGSAGLYAQIGWWDHLTHAMSASLVAAAGYTVARVIDLHNEDIYIPPKFAFVYILAVVLAFGVLWELFEFGLDLAADATGMTMPLAQRGLDDTVRDLIFNSIGAILVATFGQAHLSGVAAYLRYQLLVVDE